MLGVVVTSSFFACAIHQGLCRVRRHWSPAFSAVDLIRFFLDPTECTGGNKRWMSLFSRLNMMAFFSARGLMHKFFHEFIIKKKPYKSLSISCMPSSNNFNRRMHFLLLLLIFRADARFVVPVSMPIPCTTHITLPTACLKNIVWHFCLQQAIHVHCFPWPFWVRPVTWQWGWVVRGTSRLPGHSSSWCPRCRCHNPQFSTRWPKQSLKSSTYLQEHV